MAREPNTYTAFISPSYTFDQRRAIGEAIIEFIVDRTKSGKGIGGQRFGGPDGDGKYAKSYKDSAEFEIAGKSSRINLTLTGDMLDSLVVKDASLAGRVVIGFDDQSSNDKSVYMREKNYDFLGLSNRELNTILASFPTNDISNVVDDLAPSIAESFLRRIIGGN